MADEGEYPIGAFIVPDKISLGPLVSTLRRMGRLKPGVNVTHVDISAMTCLSAVTAVPQNDHVGLQSRWVDVNEFDDDGNNHALPEVPPSEGERKKKGCSRYRVTVPLLPASSTTTTPSTPWSFLDTLAHASSSSCTPPTHATASTYMAVHSVGRWTSDALHAMFTSRPPQEDKTTPDAGAHNSAHGGGAGRVSLPIAYIDQLRCFSRVCWPPSMLPPALAALRDRARRQHSCEPVPASSSSSAYTFAELFGGIGMFRLGMSRAGMTPAFAVELAAPACAVYGANFDKGESPVPLVGDITEIPDAFFPTHDVLTAGFPCQSFSKAGPAGGLVDAKGWLFYEVVRVLRATAPRAFLLENVENLLDVQDGAQLAVIRGWLESPYTGGGEGRNAVSYAVHQEVIDGAAVTPQKRRRVYFIGVRRDLLPASQEDTSSGGAHAEREFCCLRGVFTQARQHMATMREVSRGAQAAASSPWWRAEARYGCVRDVLEPTLPPRHPLSSVRAGSREDRALRALRLSAVQWEAVRRSKKYQAHPDWRLSELNGDARTLMGSYRTSFQLYSEFVPLTACSDTSGETDVADGSASHAHGPRDEEQAPCRFYSVRECARLQGIPEDFTFLHDSETEEQDAGVAAAPPIEGGARARGPKRLPVGAAYKLVGNAVNPLIIECIGTALAEMLRRCDV